MLKNWGLEEFGEHEYEESIEEMKHADLLIDPILFLEGTPVVQDIHKIKVGKDKPAQGGPRLRAPRAPTYRGPSPTARACRTT